MIFTAKCLWGKADPCLKRAYTSGTHTERHTPGFNGCESTQTASRKNKSAKFGEVCQASYHHTGLITGDIISLGQVSVTFSRGKDALGVDTNKEPVNLTAVG